MKDTANSFILFLLLGVVICGLTVFFFMPDRVEYLKNQALQIVQPKLVATDPNFKEVKGELLPGMPEFPAYPGAVIESSGKMVQAVGTRGYLAKWKLETPKSVSE